MQNKALKIVISIIPILIMIGLIPLIKNDYWLALIYAVIIITSWAIKYEKGEYIFLLFGFFAMTISEYFFVSTGVETFNRHSLFALMPIWLPPLWGYGFVVMRRSINILNQ